jgi:hypothetical protein
MLTIALLLVIGVPLIAGLIAFKLVSLATRSVAIRVSIVFAAVAITSFAFVHDAVAPALVLFLENDGGRRLHWLTWMVASGSIGAVVAFLHIRLKWNWWYAA